MIMSNIRSAHVAIAFWDVEYSLLIFFHTNKRGKYRLNTLSAFHQHSSTISLYLISLNSIFTINIFDELHERSQFIVSFPQSKRVSDRSTTRIWQVDNITQVILVSLAIPTRSKNYFGTGK